MQRSCSLRCRCFVTPGAVSSCKANCTAGDLHRMERARFAIQTVQSIDSTRIGHNAPFQVGILFLFSFILFVHPLFATFFSWASLILLLFLLSAFLARIYLCSVSRHGCQFRTECYSYETRAFGGPYIRLRSHRYSRHASRIWVEFFIAISSTPSPAYFLHPGHVPTQHYKVCAVLL